MNDRAVALLEQYEMEVRATRKGRGAILCDTDRGPLIFKEYAGNEAKLNTENRLLTQIRETGSVRVDVLIPTKEGALFVQDNDGVKYVLKTFYEGRECNIYDKAECLEAVRLLARIHDSMELPVEEGESGIPVFSPLKEYEKHNRELVKVRSFLRKKGQKQPFEIRLAGVLDEFLDQARQVTEAWSSYEEALLKKEKSQAQTYCHGDYQYHNIVRGESGWCVINFEKCIRDSQIRDLYLLLRKLLEKSNWQVSLGRELLAAYQELRPISAYAYIDLYYRLAYPEKFWKIANFYYNSGKAWIPEKNREKLERLIGQEREKMHFLETVFQI